MSWKVWVFLAIYLCGLAFCLYKWPWGTAIVLVICAPIAAYIHYRELKRMREEEDELS